MQGTAADLIKLAMIAVQGWLEQHKLQTRLIMQVHDELVMEVPEAELPRVKQMLPELMCGVAERHVPLLVELGPGKNGDEAPYGNAGGLVFWGPEPCRHCSKSCRY